MPRTVPVTMLLATLVLGGCATRQPEPPPDIPPPPSERFPEQPPIRPEPPEEAEPPAPAPGADEALPPRTAAQASGPAVVALLDRGETLARAGQYERAAASVERALDVEPRNPFVYRRLARLRLQQGQPGQAEALAQKSNSLAVGNGYLQARNWELIAQARRMRGDSVGADAAAGRADYYRSR